MSVEDKQVIDMTNSSSERLQNEMMEQERKSAAERQERVWQETWSRCTRKMRHKRILQAMIPALLCILAAFVVLGLIAAGKITMDDIQWAAALIMVMGIAGGMTLAEAMRC